MPKRVTILGSTGSIGTSALDVIRFHRERFTVSGLAAHRNTGELEAQIREFSPAAVAVGCEEAAANWTPPNGLTPLSGAEGVVELARRPADIVLCAMVGAAGLEAVLAAIDAGIDVALANKEPMVMAGELIMDRAEAKGVRVLPVDSEHNAIFQCLEGHAASDVHNVFLTASGGPFYGTPREQLQNVTPEQATNHPTWDMGAKISVDSATLMNKGLEVIEAMRLFRMPLDMIEVIVHPQSIIHSLVEFTDGSILAHMGVTDMRMPIQFALTWPERIEPPLHRLDLTRIAAMTFAKPDFTAFPCLKLALDAARHGGTAPAILNAANEEAVTAFCRRESTFLSISDVVAETMATVDAAPARTLDSVLEADRAARSAARAAIQRMGVPSA